MIIGVLPHSNENTKKVQFEEILAQIESLEANTIVMGDFNAITIFSEKERGSDKT